MKFNTLTTQTIKQNKKITVMGLLLFSNKGNYTYCLYDYMYDYVYFPYSTLISQLLELKQNKI